MPKGMEDAYDTMSAMAKALRAMADDLDGMVQKGLEGESESKENAVGDVVEGRAVEDITDNDVGEAVKIIRIGLG